MLTRIICFVLFAVLVGGAFGQADSLNMRLVGEWEAPAMLPGSPFHALAVQDTFAFIAGSDTLYILNIADPTNPTVITRFSGGYGWLNLDVDDTLLAATGGDGGLKIVNIANPQLPVVLDTIQSLHGIVEISITEQLVVLTGIDIIDISDPTSPDIIIEDWAPGELCGGERISLSDTFLHIAGYRVDDYGGYPVDVGEYWCYNIADPESPAFVNWRDFGDYSQTSSIDAVGMTAYVGWSDGDGNPLVTIKSTTDDTTLCTEGGGMGGIAYIDLSGQYWCYTRSSIPDYIVAMDTLFSEIGYYRAFDLWGDVEVACINDSLYVLAIGKVDDSHCALYIIKHDTIFCQIGYLDSPHRNGEEYRIFPNPILQGAKLTLDRRIESPHLFDISGRKIELPDRTINTSELSPGIYFLWGTVHNSKIVKKIVVLG